MLEHPSIRRYSSAKADSDNPTGADNQQERPREMPMRGILRDHMPDLDSQSRMIWPDLHGDVQSQAETTWPLHPPGWGSNKMNGPKVAKFLVG